ncbi:hydroxyacylglutathione hydrolase [Wenzhouxiangella sp. AB-CW3]|uniref:hydroxyacylglutathione hydrolase n=1 Tax=Wenzhouxiangella sp. AB-CW3 TaxID=2771012 RepID=UPI00168BC0A0|nr:hydroxyacylglutathione hydrolase [Wenzhouxiangella sp. AB-CW3]QOC21561.1 hydroxyacylglutathione hydrolase [Wenzhouxiangella sp. AB-CW3]
MPLSIEAIPVLDTNYVWALHDGQSCVLVDPGSADEPLAYLQNNGLEMSALLITHHHPDHTAGVNALLAHSKVPVWGPRDERIAQVSHPVGEGDRFTIDQPSLAFEVLETPGHTTSHIMFHDGRHLISGDTLFSIGCGRLFEGTPAQMLHSLDKLSGLPDELKVYCGHEYTVDNCRFARQVEPENKALQSRLAEAERLRENDQITLPSTLGGERAANPFLRVREPAVIEAANRREPGTGNDPAAVFGVIRRWKDNG